MPKDVGITLLLMLGIGDLTVNRLGTAVYVTAVFPNIFRTSNMRLT